MGENTNTSGFPNQEQDFNKSSPMIREATTDENVVKQHVCEICEKRFKTKPKLKQHISSVHDNNGKNFQCNICTVSWIIARVPI